MPELPEVETIRRDLEQRVVGHCFTGVELLWPGCVDRPAPDEFAAELPGRCVTAAERRGKYLLFRLDSGGYLVVHLRMTGRLRWRPADGERHHHLRAVLHLDDGHELQFDDQRKFGRLYLVPDAAALDAVLAKVGPEPLVPGFTKEAFRDLLKRRRAQLKPLLLDQRFLAGLGNIYVDEALFRAKLHPLRRSDTLSPEEVDRLYAGIIDALRQGIHNRGTTLSDYRDAWGTAGRNQERLLVFRREGQPCVVCGTPIEKMRVAGRGTHFCPHCQLRATDE
jgi:formamidopyrimidine-DNA glycosylase